MRYLVVILGMLLVIGGLAATKFSQISMLIGFGQAMKAAGPPPETVATVLAQKQTWNDGIEAVASVVASKGVTLSNDASGLVTQIYFDSGATVKAGQILVELDTSVERAQLASIRARRKLAETTLARSRALVASGTIAPAVWESDEAAHQGLIADEQALSAQIARKVVKAPFGGKLGLRGVNLGQFLAPGTPIAVLESTKAVFIDFTLPQSKLPLLKVGMPVQAFSEGSDTPVAAGEISAIEPSLDPLTRSVKVRATVTDAESHLNPGMFLRVLVVQPSLRQVTAIPSTAVVHAPYGDSVFCAVATKTENGLASPKKAAQQQFVKLGEARGDYVSVLDGVSEGQEVVTAGAFKLRNGIPLAINNSVKVDYQLHPTPVNR